MEFKSEVITISKEAAGLSVKPTVDSSEAAEFDPWALTELVDNSPRWSGEANVIASVIKRFNTFDRHLLSQVAPVFAPNRVAVMRGNRNIYLDALFNVSNEGRTPTDVFCLPSCKHILRIVPRLSLRWKSRLFFLADAFRRRLNVFVCSSHSRRTGRPWKSQTSRSGRGQRTRPVGSALLVRLFAGFSLFSLSSDRRQNNR